MPKATWGSDIDADEIESAVGFTTYAGDIPKRGVYRFKLRRLKQGKAKSGNPKVSFMGLLDGTYRGDHKKFEGCPLFADVAVIKNQAAKLKALCAGLGVTAADFLNKSVVDEEGNITKIGVKKITEGMLVYVSTHVGHDLNGEERLETAGDGFLAAPDDSDDADADADAEVAAATGEKPKKGKKAKGKAAEGDEVPF